MLSNEIQFVKVKIPCGFPTGKTLKSEELNTDTDDVKSIMFVFVWIYVYIYIYISIITESLLNSDIRIYDKRNTS